MKTNSKHRLWPLLMRRSIPLVFCLAGLTQSTLAAQGDSSGTHDAKVMPQREQRDPFWPVGYIPKKVLDKNLAPAQRALRSENGKDNWNEAMKQVVINGVSSRADNEFFAVINGSVKSVGDTVSVNHQGTIYTWAVDSIKPPGSVKLRRVSVR